MILNWLLQYIQQQDNYVQRDLIHCLWILWLRETGKIIMYAAFNAADRSRQSESVYLGEFRI